MNKICKHCKKEVDENNGALKQSERGFYFVCDTNIEMYHEAMDNLDYIEWLAKQKNLV